MLTDEGLVGPYQKEASGPKYWPAPDRPTQHGAAESTGDGGYYMRHSSGLKCTFRTSPSDGNYWLTKKEDQSGNALNFTYNGGPLPRVEANDGSWVEFYPPVWGESAPAGTNPKSIVRIKDNANRRWTIQCNAAKSGDVEFAQQQIAREGRL